MEEKKYLIGEVSKITGISRDTLRFWDKINLLKPRYVDPQNGYRYYTYDQFWRIDLIACFRSLDVSINTIRSILQSNNNKEVLELLLEQQDKAKALSEYYSRVVEDIEWYIEQDHQISEEDDLSIVTIKTFPERKVLYAQNAENVRAYHLKLQELCKDILNHPYSIRRGYGFILDENRMKDGGFIKKGEYINFYGISDEKIDDKYLTTIPGGTYACCLVNVLNDRADFSVLTKWLEKERIDPHYVIADETGLQMFEYLDYGYLCEVKVMLN